MPKKPRRADYRKEAEWLSAALAYIARKHPDDQAARVRAWRALDDTAAEYLREQRLKELHAADPHTENGSE